MPFGMIGSIIGAGISSGASSANNERNIAMQRETNAQNERLMRESWGREDNAIQRRVTDLNQAGLSPVLAAGAAASSSSPIKMDAPSSQDAWGPTVGAAMQNKLNMSQISKTDIDTKRTAAEIGNIAANTSKTVADESAVHQNMEQQMLMNSFTSKAISASTFRDLVEASRKRYELERDKKSGLGERSSSPARMAQDAIEGANATINRFVAPGSTNGGPGTKSNTPWDGVPKTWRPN